MTLGNTTSPGGGYLFGGFQSASQPFTQNSAGAVVYNGDNGVSSVQISDSTSVATGDSGAAVFLSVTPQTASPVPAAPRQYRHGDDRRGEHQRRNGCRRERRLRDQFQRDRHRQRR